MYSLWYDGSAVKAAKEIEPFVIAMRILYSFSKAISLFNLVGTSSRSLRTHR